MPAPNESFIAVQTATNPGKRVATYEFTNNASVVVESEAVTLTDSSGDELLGAKPSAECVPVVLATDQAPVDISIVSTPATLANGAETPVTSAGAVEILPANASRAQAIIQNTGGASIRIGVVGVTASTGLRLVPNAIYTYGNPNVTQQAIFAIAEAADSIAFAQEAST